MNGSLADMVGNIVGYDDAVKKNHFTKLGCGSKPWSIAYSDGKGSSIEIRNSKFTHWGPTGERTEGYSPAELERLLLVSQNLSKEELIELLLKKE